MASKNKATIVICTEKGDLEIKSRLLVRSIRKYGGDLKHIPIISYQPRIGKGISFKTKKFFDEHQVTINDLELNKEYADYPLANKPLVCSHAAKTLDSDTIVFLDSDVLVVNSPMAFLLEDKIDVLLRPVDVKNIGTEDENDPNIEYWNKLYEICKVKDHRRVSTFIGEKSILAYWNSGHIVNRKSSGLFQMWEENFRKVMSEGLQPMDGIFFVEQSTFAATVCAMDLKVATFSNDYNYPIHLQHSISNPEKQNQ